MSITLDSAVVVQPGVTEISTDHIKVGEVIISRQDENGDRKLTVEYETFDGVNVTEYKFEITVQGAIQNIIDNIDNYVIAQGWLSGTVD